MSSMNHNATVVDENESEMTDWEQRPFHHESTHPISCNQPNDQVKKDDVVINLKAIIGNNKEGLLSPTCCIYRVPPFIRERKEVYTPKAISIGPFHRGNVRLQNMEGHKQIFFKRFIQEAMPSLDDLVNFAKLLEPEVRACYSENIKLTKEELVQVILVDGGFIIELFMNSRLSHRVVDSNTKLSKPWLMNFVVLDLLLLENQLPFFFLEELFNRAFPLDIRGDDIPSFRKLTYDFFGYYNVQKLEPNTIKHFTDLVRLFHLPRWEYPIKILPEVKSKFLLYSVSELQEAGLKFKINKSKCLLNFNFSRQVLEIPEITVDNKFETMLHNMIALEQCHYPYESYIADYAHILDCLINTSKDVDVLIHEGIIGNYEVDSTEVVKVFNGLCKNITQVGFNSDYLEICQRLNEFYKNPWHKTKATLRRDYYETLKRDYCNTPWKKAASIAAVVLLIFSLIQTICSVLQVPHVARIFKT